MKDTFTTFHPIVNFIYFFAVIGFTMFIRQPVCLGIAILSATVYSVYLNGKKSIRFAVCYLVPMMLLLILVNPLFNHEGLTILAYFPSGNPFTLEAVIYGILAAAIVVAVIQWFSCWNRIMTTDKLVYLFGRILPALSLVLSMALRFVPRYRRQFQAIAEAQRQIGIYKKNGNLWFRMRLMVRTLSIMLTWAMEHAVETANAMKCRGYGLEGRTAFSLYRWAKRDTVVLLCILGLGIFVLVGILQGKLYWTCFPTFTGAKVNGYTVGIYGGYGLLSLLPMLINGREEWKWNSFN